MSRSLQQPSQDPPGSEDGAAMAGTAGTTMPDADVAREARETAQRIADGAPLVARWHKAFARRLRAGGPLSEAEYLECFDCFDTEDFRIGYRAFLAKTKPQFVGR